MLKDFAMMWFQSLEGNSIFSWAELQDTFSCKYEEHCKRKTLEEEILKIMWKDMKPVEEFQEWLTYLEKLCMGISPNDNTFELEFL